MVGQVQLDHPVVLIVEDHPMVRQVMREFLQSAFPDCSFREAADGAAALAACHGCRLQLVLMDIEPPDANGIELTVRLRTLYPGMEVIIVSQYSSEAHVERALAAGARAYVCKNHFVTSLVPAVAVAVAIGIAPARVPGLSGVDAKHD